MTSPEMTDNNQKEIKQEVKKLEDINLADSISPEEAKEINDAIKSLNENTTDNEKINEDINKQKKAIKETLIKQFTSTEINNKQIVNVTIKTDEIAKINTPELAQAYINIIDQIWWNELNIIKTAITEQLQTLNTQANTTAEAAEKQKVIDILSPTTPNKLFETGSEQDFITIMKYLCKHEAKKTISKTTTDAYEKKLLELVNTYKKTDEKNEIISITIGQAKKGDFAKEYKEGTWMIEYTENNENKHISRGSNKHLEELKAEQAAEDWDFDENVFALDFTPDTWEKWIAYFDKDMGYFAGFQKFITIQEEKTPWYVVQYLPRIMEEINEVQPGKEVDPTFVKNGYADVLTKYIIDNKNNPELLKTYLEGLNSQNLNLLGVDQATRTKNYNALFFADVQNKILHPEIQAYINGLDDTQKKAFAEKIGAIKLGIDGVEKTSSVETLKKAANGVLKMLLGLFQQLGIGKATLSRRFGEENVSKLFLEEYGLNDKIKAQAITNISKEMTEEKDKNKREATINAYKSGIFPSWGDIQKSFDKDKEKYITEITKEENAKYINPAVLKKCLDTYNKDNWTTLSILDIITTEKKDGKDIINTIKDPNNLKKIMTHYLDKDAVWTEIAAANKSIGSPTKIDTIVQTYNESGINIDTAIQKYCIIDNQDTARFLTASFFSDKHLESTITTNELHNGKEVVINNNSKIEDKPAVELPEEKLTFKDGVDATGVVTDWSKMIQDVIDMTTAPEKIKVTRWTEKTIAVKKEITIWTDKIITYIPEANKDKKTLTIDDRVKIKEKDKIEAIQKSDYLYQENNKNITKGLKNITTTEPKKYKNFDFTAFTYEITPTDTDKKDYQENLLTPISGILTDQEQFKLLFTDTKINDKLKAIWPINLKNTFTMMDSTEQKKYTDLITNITDSATITAVNNTITITQTTWTITIGYTTDNKLETKREEKAAT